VPQSLIFLPFGVSASSDKGYDARHHSKQFVEITAAVFLSLGLPVHLFGCFVPTPFVAAAVRYMGAAAGVMVTASHNQKEYNGYKVGGWVAG
jgi:phosphomannomutase